MADSTIVSGIRLIASHAALLLVSFMIAGLIMLVIQQGADQVQQVLPFLLATTQEQSMRRPEATLMCHASVGPAAL